MEGIAVLPSHYYYRFLPKDSLEHDRIINDTILQVSNVPLHYEVEQEGDFYDDPELDGDESPEAFSYLFSVVPYDYQIPEGIHNEHLDDLYFAPELDDKEPLQEGEIAVKHPQNMTTAAILTVDDSGNVFEYLELEALKLTNNLDEEELDVLQFYLPDDTSGTRYRYEEAVALGYAQKDLIIDLTSVDMMLEAEELASRRRKWNPNGRVTVWEDAINQTVGVVGAEVKVRKWGFKVIKRGRTNSSGHFRTSSTRTKRVKYAVYFNSPGRFRVMAGSTLVRARHRGTRRYKRSGWNQHFSSGRGQFYALVHNAAYDYFSRAVPSYGLKRPRSCTISAKYDRDVSSQHRPAWMVFASDIRITRLRNGRYRGSDGVYATTAHELTHAGHRELDPGIFSSVARSCRRTLLMESWAEGVETILTNDRYLLLDGNYQSSFPNDRNGRWNSWRQRQTVAQMNEYTPIVEDLIDDVNQNTLLGIHGNQPVDNVDGYRLSQIQSALNGSRFPDTWRDKLNGNRPSGVTTAELNTLFSYMNQVLNNPQTCD